MDQHDKYAHAYLLLGVIPFLRAEDKKEALLQALEFVEQELKAQTQADSEKPAQEPWHLVRDKL